MKRLPWTGELVVCESDDCSPRGSRPMPHQISADCQHPRRIQQAEQQGGES